MLARSAEWAATGRVTLPADPGPARPAAGPPIRALLVVGGLDHEATFYSLFRGDNDLGRLPIVAGDAALRDDIRGKVDAVILYDFTRDLAAPARQHLRDFVAGGGGVVVLHHAQPDYQDWPWWGDEAVGGSYRLAPPPARRRFRGRLGAHLRQGAGPLPRDTPPPARPRPADPAAPPGDAG